ncbi:hypothetical protein BD414DRAFT_503433 [Trametes punicea]|nr:hypothetical protein BD414DRAFT_503433 [Trametes punicea]
MKTATARWTTKSVRTRHKPRCPTIRARSCSPPRKAAFCGASSALGEASTSGKSKMALSSAWPSTQMAL